LADSKVLDDALTDIHLLMGFVFFPDVENAFILRTPLRHKKNRRKPSMNKIVRTLALYGSALFMLACSGNDSNPTQCETVGETAECGCLGDDSGFRTCGEDMTFGSCECPDNTNGGVGGQSGNSGNEAGVGGANPTENECYRCLNNDPYFVPCSETTEQSDGTTACIAGDDVQPCATVSQCCDAAGGRPVTEEGVCAIGAALGDECVTSADCVVGICVEVPGLSGRFCFQEADDGCRSNGDLICSEEETCMNISGRSGRDDLPDEGSRCANLACPSVGEGVSCVTTVCSSGVRTCNIQNMLGPCTCPETFLPCGEITSGDQSACETTIFQVKKVAVVPDGSRVGIVGVVSGLRLNADNEYTHLILAIPANDPNYAGSDNGAVWVYLNNSDIDTIGQQPPVVGSYIQLVGTVKTHYGQRQLEKVEQVVNLTVTASVPEPIEVLSTDIALNGPRAWTLEGALVRISNIEVINATPIPGPGDGLDGVPTYEYEVSGGLIINDFIYKGLPQPAAGDQYAEITGFLRYANDTFKLEPRNSQDVR
jgi:hypothetical protein